MIRRFSRSSPTLEKHGLVPLKLATTVKVFNFYMYISSAPIPQVFVRQLSLFLKKNKYCCLCVCPTVGPSLRRLLIPDPGSISSKLYVYDVMKWININNHLFLPWTPPLFYFRCNFFMSLVC